MEPVQTRLQGVYEALKGDFNYTNVNQAPTVEKIVVSVGTGRIEDKQKIALIQDRLAKITGQKAAPRPAKQSIAAFKLREGDIIGYQVTLRGERKIDFLNKLIFGSGFASAVDVPHNRFRGLVFFQSHESIHRFDADFIFVFLSGPSIIGFSAHFALFFKDLFQFSCFHFFVRDTRLCGIVSKRSPTVPWECS